MKPAATAALALSWAFACYAGLRLIVMAMASLGRRPLDLAALGAAAALTYTLGTWGVLRSDPTAPTSGRLALRPTHPLLGLLGLGLGLSLKIPAESIRALTERIAPTDQETLLQKIQLYQARDIEQVVIMVAVVCLVAPLVEELFFRGALYGLLAKSSTALAATLSGVLFVVAHADVRDWPALMLVALVLSVVRAVGGSLLPCLALHVAFNAVGVLALVTGASSVVHPLSFSGEVELSSWLVVGGLLFVLYRLAMDPLVVRARREDEA